MDIAALIIARFGAVMAVLSLGWQIAAWMMVSTNELDLATDRQLLRGLGAPRT